MIKCARVGALFGTIEEVLHCLVVLGGKAGVGVELVIVVEYAAPIKDFLDSSPLL